MNLSEMRNDCRLLNTINTLLFILPGAMVNNTWIYVYIPKQ